MILGSHTLGRKTRGFFGSLGDGLLVGHFEVL